MKTHLFLVLLLTSLLAACSGQKTVNPVQASDATAAPLAVKVMTAENRRVERTISVTGSLLPDESVTVSNEVAGRVARIRVDFGQQVRQGDIIAELDKQELQLQLDRIRASLAQALARIGLKPGQENVTPETTPAIRQAQAQLEDARTRYESASKLVKTGDIASDRYVEVEKALHAREAALDAARHELETALASIQALRAEVQLAEKRLRDATILAPFTGQVSERIASTGQYLRENTPIITLVKTNPLRLRVDIPESAAAAVRVGTGLTFTTGALEGDEFQAVVRELNPSLDPRSRSLTAEARLVNNDGRLRPGMFVQVKLVVDRDAVIVVVPREAVQTVAGLTKIFAIQEGRAVEKKILPGMTFDGWVEVRGAELNAGEMVAVSQLGVLVDGAAVRPEPAARAES